MPKKKTGKKSPKLKKKLTPEQKTKRKADKAERQKKYQWIFMNGKQVRIKRPPSDEALEEMAAMIRCDPLFLHRNEMWEYMEPEFGLYVRPEDEEACVNSLGDDEQEVPF